MFSFVTLVTLVVQSVRFLILPTDTDGADTDRVAAILPVPQYSRPSTPVFPTSQEYNSLRDQPRRRDESLDFRPDAHLVPVDRTGHICHAHAMPIQLLARGKRDTNHSNREGHTIKGP